MTAPAVTGGARSPLKAYAVRVTLANGQRIDYHTLAGCSVAALQAALEAHGINRIAIQARLRKMK